MKPAGALQSSDLVRMFAMMSLIRYFEDRVFALFAKGKVAGSTHLCQGQEAVAVGACFAAEPSDMMVTTYRGHGHCLAKGLGPYPAMAEILGRRTGCCRGKGGSMHLTDVSVGVMGEFAIVGAGIPVATGLAWAVQARQTERAVLCFFGDGATNIGAFHEGLNLAAVWRLPVVFVCENNLYGEYSPIQATTPVTDIAVRATSYGMNGQIVDGNDVEMMYGAVRAALARARSGEGPALIEAKTYRQKGHSRNDPATYRPPGELETWLARDPIMRLHRKLIESGVLSEAEADAIQDRAQTTVAEAEAKALSDPEPEVTELTRDVFSEDV